MRRATTEEAFDAHAARLLGDVCDCMEVVKEVHLALQGYLNKISEPSHKTLVEVEVVHKCACKCCESPSYEKPPSK
jgi:hypothetical protein